MKIRAMQTGDIEEVYQTGMNAEGFMVSEKTGFWEKDELYRWIGSGQDVLLVAEENKKIMGYVTSQLHRPTGLATIVNIYVDEKIGKEELARSC